MKKLKSKKKAAPVWLVLPVWEHVLRHFIRYLIRTRHVCRSVEKKAVRPIACPQCGKCAEACPEGAITPEPERLHDQQEKMYGMRSLCEGLSIWPDRKNRGQSGFQMYCLRYLRESLSDGCTGSCGRIMIRTLRYRQDLV